MDVVLDLAGLVLAITVVGMCVGLLHEMGHALAAQDRLGTPVEVTVGDVGELARFQLGEITASINLWAQLGPVAGVAEFDDSRATARDIVWIALAGPVVSCVAAALTAIVIVQLPAEGIVHGLLRLWLIGNVIGALNVIPFELSKRSGEITFRSDGRLALDALKVVRELR